MKETPEIRKWWSVKKHYVLIPKSFANAYRFFFYLTIALMACAILSANYFKNSGEPEGVCIKQMKDMEDNTNELQADIDVAIKRIAIFESQLTDKDAPRFIDARDLLACEKKIKERKEKALKRYTPDKNSGFYLLILLLTALMTAYLLLVRWGFYAAYKGGVLKDSSDFKKWVTPYIIIAVICAVPVVLNMFYTSIWAKEKMFYSMDSYCVSRATFVFEILCHISYSLVLSAPLTFLWVFTRRELRKPVNLAEYSSYIDAKKYVYISKTFTIIMIAITGMVSMTFLLYMYSRIDESFVIYIPVLFGTISIISLLMMRLIYNVYSLRMEYEEAIDKLTLKHMEDKIVWKDDPAATFFGDKWIVPGFIVTLLTNLVGFGKYAREVLDNLP